MRDCLTFKVLDVLLSNVVNIDLLKSDMIKLGLKADDMFDWEVFERFITLETGENHWIHNHGYKKRRKEHVATMDMNDPERWAYTTLIVNLVHAGVFLESEWRIAAQASLSNVDDMTIFEVLQRYLLFDMASFVFEK